MIEHVGRIFSVRRSEIGTASLLFFYLFLVTGAYMMGQAVGDAMFLNVFPNHLPYAMIGSALMSGALVAVYIWLSARVRLESLIVATLAFFAFSFALFWWLTQLQNRWVCLLVLIWVYVAGAIWPMMGWTLANYTLTTREARRIYGFIGAGALLGGAVVSFTTADMVHRGRMQPQNALLAMALILAVCALLVRRLFRSAGPRLATMSQAAGSGQETPQNFGQSLKLIRSSRYLRLLTALIAIGCLATCILGYQFKIIAKDAYIGNTEGLVDFFCRFNGYMGLAAFIFQLVLTPLLLSKVGIRLTLFVVPVVLMGTSLGVLAAPTLLMGGILRGSHYILRFSLDKSSTELLYVPVSPWVRSQVKSFIDSFIWRSADGIAGLILLLFTNVLKFSPSEVSLVNLAALAGWVWIANAVRREYLNALRQAIDRRVLDPERTAAQMLDSTTTEILAQALECKGEEQLLYGMSLFEIGNKPGRHPALRCLLEHRSPAVRLKALRLLDNAGDLAIQPQAERLLGDEDLEVRAAALRYLVAHAGRDPLTLLSRSSDLPAHVMQGAVMVFLARSGEPEYSATAGIMLQSMLAQAGPEGLPARREAALVLGLVPPPSELHARLRELLLDENSEVVEQALLSAGKSRVHEFLPMVIGKLGQPRLVASARAALVEYGRRAVGTLQSCLNDNALPPSVRSQIPKTLARIPVAESASALAHSLSQRDPGLRYEVLKALNTLRDRDPALLPGDVDYADLINAELIGYYRSFQVLAALDSQEGKNEGIDSFGAGALLLKRAFREHMEGELEHIFRFLALIYPPRDMHNAFVGLTSDRPQLQANALEMLEHLLQPELYRCLSGAVDPDRDLQKRLDSARRFCGVEGVSRPEALRILLHSEDCWLRACTLYTVGRLRLTELSPAMNRVACDHAPLLAETRDWALARLASSAQA
jgi:AAA family ATP:ADP antiporter